MNSTFNINVVTNGNIANTPLIFLAGSGVTSPSLEYKKLYSKFTNQRQIAVIEKLGYGYSDSNTNSPRDIETIVNQNRNALIDKGIKPPYILVPHSYSGLEAIFWATAFPEEIKAILGLDMVTPNFALAQAKEVPAEKLEQIIAQQNKLFKKITKSKLIQKVFKNKLVNVSGIMKDSFFTNEEKAEYEKIFYKNLCNSEISDEQRNASNNAQIIIDKGFPKCLGHMFITDMKNSMVKKTSWRAENTEFAKEVCFEYTYTDQSHFLYNTIPDKIFEIWQEFLKKNDL